MRRQGPVTVLTLLFGLLVGIAGGAGLQLQIEPGTAQLRPGDTLRRAPAFRAVRTGDDQADSEDPILLVPPTPRPVSETLWARPVADPAPAVAIFDRSGRFSPYRARAPPAA